MKPECTKSDLQTMSISTNDFKNEAFRAFANYQASLKGTLTFHLLEHLTEDLWTVGSIKYFQAEFFEAAHESSKNPYGRTSEKHKSVMQEMIKQDFFFIREAQKEENQHWHRDAKKFIEADICRARWNSSY